MPESYTYRRLRPALQEIRLLEVLPDNASEHIRVNILHTGVTLLRPSWLRFETISYVWGDPTRSGRLVVIKDGLSLPTGSYLAVPVNTEAALRRVRLLDKPRTIWIDAVSINQDDLTERSQQVAMMGQIYAGSTRNLVYLGELDDETVAHRISSTIKALVDDAAFQTDDFRTFRSLIFDASTPNSIDSALQFDCDHDAMLVLLESSWFRYALLDIIPLLSLIHCRRLWVLQEATLAPKNTVLLGPIQLDLLVVLRGVVWWAYHPGRPSLSQQAAASLRCLYQIFNFVDHKLGSLTLREPKLQKTKRPITIETAHSPHGQPRGIRNLLLTAMDFEKTEGRDGVYAMLGMMAVEVPGTLTPDYARSLPEVLQTATRYAIVEARGLTILNHVEHRLDDLECGSVASWALRVDRQSDRAGGCHLFSNTHRAYSTPQDPPIQGWKDIRVFLNYDTGQEEGEFVRSLADASKPNVLRVRGYLVEAVYKATRSCTREEYDHQGDREYLPWLKEALELYLSATRTNECPRSPRAFAMAVTSGGTSRS